MMNDSAEGTRLVLGGSLLLARGGGLWYGSVRSGRTAERMREAQHVSSSSSSSSSPVYAMVRGRVEATGAPLVAEYSGERAVVTRTFLKHRWSERRVHRRKDGGVSYGKWEQHEELVNEPVLRSTPFAVVHRYGQVPAAVAVEWRVPDQVPLQLRYSRMLEEDGRGGGGININNSNNNTSGGGVADGTRERRELGTLREEHIVPCGGDGAALTVWGMLRSDELGGLVISCEGTRMGCPWVCTWRDPESVLAERERRARLLRWAGMAATLGGVGVFGFWLKRSLLE